MKLYITFGQAHAHALPNVQTLDKDTVAEIECNDENHGREIAFSLFGPVWGFAYPNNPPEMRFFPKGIVPVN